MSELPECPNYVAHPQAVWFEVHWRPVIERLRAENERLKELCQNLMEKVTTPPDYMANWEKTLEEKSQLKYENELMREAIFRLQAIRGGLDGCCFSNTSRMAEIFRDLDAKLSKKD